MCLWEFQNKENLNQNKQKKTKENPYIDTTYSNWIKVVADLIENI